MCILMHVPLCIFSHASLCIFSHASLCILMHSYAYSPMHILMHICAAPRNLGPTTWTILQTRWSESPRDCGATRSMGIKTAEITSGFCALLAGAGGGAVPRRVRAGGPPGQVERLRQRLRRRCVVPQCTVGAFWRISPSSWRPLTVHHPGTQTRALPPACVFVCGLM